MPNSDSKSVLALSRRSKNRSVTETVWLLAAQQVQSCTTGGEPSLHFCNTYPGGKVWNGCVGREGCPTVTLKVSWLCPEEAENRSVTETVWLLAAQQVQSCTTGGEPSLHFCDTYPGGKVWNGCVGREGCPTVTLKLSWLCPEETKIDRSLRQCGCWPLSKSNLAPLEASHPCISATPTQVEKFGMGVLGGKDAQQ